MSLTDLGAVILRQMDPETAHRLAIRALQVTPLPAPGADDPILKTRIAGLEMSNPVGLAAGLDKNGEAIGGLSRLGFGFVECGSVTPRPQPGNPKPRLFRLSEDRAIINRFGFNNEGAEVIAARLAARPGPYPQGIPVGLNIGANKDSTDRSADFAQVVRVAGHTADFLTVNVSSPNTEKLRDLQGPEALGALLKSVIEARDALATRPPVFIKIAPDLDDAALADIAAVALAAPVDAIIATNTTLSREGISSAHANETGGLSGAPLFERSTRILARLYRETAGQVPLIGVGGISSPEEAWHKLRAGASAIQIYSAMIYQGLSVASEIARAIDDRLSREGMTLTELTGSGNADWT